MYKEKIKYIVNNQNAINNFVKSIMNKEVHILPYEEILDVMAILEEESPVMENYIKHECNIAEYADPAWQKEPFFVYGTLKEPIVLCDRYGCALPIFLTQELYEYIGNIREKTLEKLANRLADKVVKTKRSVRLEPMNPYERKVIHATLQSNPRVTTRSEGQDPYRRVIIELK